MNEPPIYFTIAPCCGSTPPHSLDNVGPCIQDIGHRSHHLGVTERGELFSWPSHSYRAIDPAVWR